jgi:hypothetical protein
MQIEPWQIPVLAMAALALPVSIDSLIRWVRKHSRGASSAPEPDAPTPPTPERVRGEKLRTTLLATLTVVLVGLFILALGPAAASILTSVASAVSALVSAVMTVQSYLALVAIRSEITRSQAPAPADSGGSAGGADDQPEARTSSPQGAESSAPGRGDSA